MKSRIISFDIFESTHSNQLWAGDWQKLPEWEFLKMMGFVEMADRTTPYGTISIRPPDSMGIFRLTSAGYVRNAPQGYLFQTRKSNPIVELLQYMINKFVKKEISKIPIPSLESFFTAHPEKLDFLLELPELREQIVSRTGIKDPLAEAYKKYNISPSTIKWLNRCSGRSWRIDEKTGVIDVDSGFKADEGNSLGFRGVVFGRINGNFVCNKIGLRSLKGSPREVLGNFECLFNELDSLEGAPEKIGGVFVCRSPRKSSEPFYIEIKWEMKEILENFLSGTAKEKSLLAPFISQQEMDRYFLENPTDLYVLDKFPEVKKGVLQRTGLEDFSRLGRFMNGGLL
jgi:hypothetical protein